MESCVFCRINNNEIPSWKVYETELVMVLLAKEMEIFWHTLIIPKVHYKDITDIPRNTLADIMEVTNKIILHYQNTLWSIWTNIIGATGEGAQQSIPHFHFHLLPRFKDDGLDTRPKLPDNEIDKDKLLQKIKILE